MIRNTEASECQGTVVMIHGFGEHHEIFLELAFQFALNGFEVRLIDQRGFGFSGGSRCGNVLVEDFHSDLGDVIGRCRDDVPLFLFGHSMGGFSVAGFCMNNPELNISGIMLSAPLLDFGPTVNVDAFKLGFLESAGEALEEFLCNPLINITSVSSNNDCVKWFIMGKRSVPFLGMRQVKSLFSLLPLMRYNARE